MQRFSFRFPSRLVPIIAAIGVCVLSANETQIPADQEEAESIPATVTSPVQAVSSHKKVIVVPIDGPIATPTEFIIRRAVKEAIDKDIDAIVIHMHTPGGALGNTLKIMEMLDRFKGLTMTFIDTEAISAGAYITASTDEIYMAPKAMIGAAAVVSGSGEDVPETMKQKIDSVLRAKVRTLSETHRYRGDVIRAMMDASFVLEIDGKVIKGEDELLSLTASEATALYGDPAEPLLALGIYENLESLLKARFGEGGYVVAKFELTWSEDLAKVLNTLIPAILGISFLLIFIEFKTPGFGIFGILGITGIVFVFISQYVAGFAGYEPFILFILGLLALAVEIFILPGTIVFGVVGIGLMLGSLVWSMLDIWPNQDFTVNPPDFSVAFGNLGIAFLITLLGIIFLAKVLPRTPIWNALVMNKTLTAADVGAILTNADSRPPIGAVGVAITEMLPSGQLEIEGRRFTGQSVDGPVAQGESVRVIRYSSFALVVEKISPTSQS